MTGRPTKCTAELTESICKALEETGAYIETVCEAEGISKQTLYSWVDRGAKGEEPFAAFLDALTRARAKAELDLLRTVKTGDGKGESFGQARSACFLLERTRPNKYAQRINMKVEEAVGEVLEVVRRVCSPEDFARICERLEGVDSQGGEELPAGDPGEAEQVH